MPGADVLRKPLVPEPLLLSVHEAMPGPPAPSVQEKLVWTTWPTA